MSGTNKKDMQALFQAFSQLRDSEEARQFLADLCTPAELVAMADRWKTARLLEEGHSYRDINEKTGVSTATVTRVARCLTLGAGGYRRALDRLRALRVPSISVAKKTIHKEAL